MSDFSLKTDALVALATPDVQRLAARMAQDAFTRIFRLTLDGIEDAIQDAVAGIVERVRNWGCAAGDDDARVLRLALLVTGVDQWRLAYCQAFGLVTIPGIGTLIGALSSDPDAAFDSRFQQSVAAIENVETDAIDFKTELKRNIHMALWHAMIACDERDEALAILAVLGGMMVALVRGMPVTGWRLVADTLAHIQLRCLMDTDASKELARQTTHELFSVLRQALPRETFDPILAQANQVVVAWHQSRRPMH